MHSRYSLEVPERLNISVLRIATIFEPGDAQLPEHTHFAVLTGAGVEREQNRRALINAVKLTRFVVPHDGAPCSLRFQVVAPERNALLADGNAHRQLND